MMLHRAVRVLAAAGFVSAMLPGCTAYLVTEPEKFDQTEREGLVYYLPRSVLDVTFTYRVFRPVLCKRQRLAGGDLTKVRGVLFLDPDGKPVVVNRAGQRLILDKENKLPVPGEAYVVVLAPEKKPATLVALIEGPVSVAARAQADPGLAFRVDPLAMEHFMVAVEGGKFAFSPEGVLTGVNAALQDKSAQVVSGLIASAINIAKMATVPGAAKMINPASERLTESEGKPWTELVLVGEKKFEKTVTLEEFSAVGRVNTMHESTRDFTATPEQIGSFRGQKVGADRIQPLRVRLRAPQDLQAVARTTAENLLGTAVAKDSKEKRGRLFFRIPGPVAVEVSVGPMPEAAALQKGPASGFTTIATKQITLGEAGGFGFLRIQSRPFSSRTYGLALSSTTGGVSTYEFASSSQAESLATMLSAQSKSISDTAKDWETDRLEQETARLEAEAALIRARADLEKARKGE